MCREALEYLTPLSLSSSAASSASTPTGATDQTSPFRVHVLFPVANAAVGAANAVHRQLQWVTLQSAQACLWAMEGASLAASKAATTAAAAAASASSIFELSVAAGSSSGSSGAAESDRRPAEEGEEEDGPLAAAPQEENDEEELEEVAEAAAQARRDADFPGASASALDAEAQANESLLAGALSVALVLLVAAMVNRSPASAGANKFGELLRAWMGHASRTNIVTPVAGLTAASMASRDW